MSCHDSKIFSIDMKDMETIQRYPPKSSTKFILIYIEYGID